MEVITNTLILIGAMLIGVELRLNLPFGIPLGVTYIAQSIPLYFILILCVLGISGASTRLRRYWILSSVKWQFFALLLEAGFSFVAVALILHDISLLQLLYFVLAAVIIGLLVLLLPSKVLKNRRPSLMKDLRILWANGYLLNLWVRNNVRARYTQTILGILWIILLPLAQSLILSFVFDQFLHMDVGDVPFISFFLAALVPWSFFNQSIMNSTLSVTGMISLINQIYFPREILVLVKLGETLVDTVFVLIALVVIDLMVGILPNIYYIYLPILFFITICFTLGLTLFISYLSVLIRDIPQLLFVILQLLFYLTPIVYPESFIPAQFRLLILINPLAPIVQAYRDIIAYQRMPNWVSLYYPLVVSLVLLYLGYSFFKANERRLADFV